MLGDGRAVDLYELRRRARALLMEHAGEQALARARFPCDQDGGKPMSRCLAGEQRLHLLAKGSHLRTSPDQSIRGHGGALSLSSAPESGPPRAPPRSETASIGRRRACLMWKVVAGSRGLSIIAVAEKMPSSRTPLCRSPAR